jgi:mannose-1-phosphate guanylyltransferase
MHSHRYAVIMAGGSGTRFWPASRYLRPKQFLPLGPNAQEPLLLGTVRRMREIVPVSRIFVATGTHLVQATHALLPDLPPSNILAEPTPRNTAPCIAWANAVIQRQDPDAIVAVLSADHVAEDESAFSTAIDQALQVAEKGTITTIGIRPTRPETGYGYIELGPPLSEIAHEVLRFVEKPNLPDAQRMVESQQFLWNAGFFFFRASQMTQAFEQHLPELAQGVRDLDQAAQSGQEILALQRLFPNFPSVSIDVGVMEKVSPLAVVPASFGWSDVGTWQTAWELGPKDATGNVAPQDAITIDCHDNIVADWSSQPDGGRTVALIGVEGLVVVQTDDALLVMPRDRCQDVRQVVEALRKRGRTDRL